MAPVETTSKEQYVGMTAPIQRIKTTTASQIKCGLNEGVPIDKNKRLAVAEIVGQNVNQVALNSEKNVPNQGSILIVSFISLLRFLR